MAASLPQGEPDAAIKTAHTDAGSIEGKDADLLAMVLAEVAGGTGADTEQEIKGRKVSYAARRWREKLGDRLAARTTHKADVIHC